MSYKTVFSLFLILCVSIAYCGKAELLFHKKIVDSPVVGKELPVQFVIYNVGSEPAYELEFDDKDFLTSDFEFVSGSSAGKWESLAPQSHVSQNITIIPKKAGIYTLTSTVLNYLSSQHEKEVSITTAASYSGMYVESLQDYDKRTSLHVKEWTLFVLFSLASVAFPFSIWAYYKVNYEHGIKKEK
ncbi:hypothetical protein CYY_010134 [Polysphondylium violaceum]|uniref:Translocon-associated protein subunit beta n=1 Tax=Polysphondylium violaceum TaxID=133409 RepID=A0A8J4PKM6_9MYCE|nr:hypothetical protein CYY_010134 [Polysphondylium violaceum]